MALAQDELIAAVEAVIFVSSEPVTLARLREVFTDESQEALENSLSELARAFERPGRGLLLDRVAGGWRIATRPDVHQHVARFVQQERSERLSLRTLETLSVIAYKQPVTAAEIQEIRGVDPAGTIKTLIDRGLVRIAGRKKVVGRPFVYGTTGGFLTTFGLNELDELPTLKELENFATDVVTTDPSEVESDAAMVTAAASAPGADAGGDSGEVAAELATDADPAPARGKRRR